MGIVYFYLVLYSFHISQNIALIPLLLVAVVVTVKLIVVTLALVEVIAAEIAIIVAVVVI